MGGRRPSRHPRPGRWCRRPARTSARSPIAAIRYGDCRARHRDDGRDAHRARRPRRGDPRALRARARRARHRRCRCVVRRAHRGLGGRPQGAGAQPVPVRPGGVARRAAGRVGAGPGERAHGRAAAAGADRRLLRDHRLGRHARAGARPALGRARRRLRPSGAARRRAHGRPRRGVGLRAPAAHARRPAAGRGLRRGVLGGARRPPQGVGRLRRRRLVPPRRRRRPGPAGAHPDRAHGRCATAPPPASRSCTASRAPCMRRTARPPPVPGSCCPRRAGSPSPTPTAASRSRRCAPAATACRCGRRRAPRRRPRSTCPASAIDVEARADPRAARSGSRACAKRCPRSPGRRRRRRGHTPRLWPTPIPAPRASCSRTSSRSLSWA